MLRLVSRTSSGAGVEVCAPRSGICWRAVRLCTPYPSRRCEDSRRLEILELVGRGWEALWSSETQQRVLQGCCWVILLLWSYSIFVWFAFIGWELKTPVIKEKDCLGRLLGIQMYPDFRNIQVKTAKMMTPSKDFQVMFKKKLHRWSTSETLKADP